MTNAEIILSELDRRLESRIELTLYGRAALQLGFKNPLPDFAVSRDVDAILFLGQAESLNEHTNFWPAVDDVNRKLADQELYISHFFVEDQVILSPDWDKERYKIWGDWVNLDLYRLGDRDLLLSKLMRDDPIDHADALFICSRAGFKIPDIVRFVASARIPESAEIKEQFELASKRLLNTFSY